MTDEIPNPEAEEAKALMIEINDHRRAIVRGETITDDQLRASIQKLHAFRASKHMTLEAASKKKGAKAKKTSEKKAAASAASLALGDLL